MLLEFRSQHVVLTHELGFLCCVGDFTTAIHTYYYIVDTINLDLVADIQVLGAFAKLQIDGILAHLLFGLAYQRKEFGIHVDSISAEVILRCLIAIRTKLPHGRNSTLVAYQRPWIDVLVHVYGVQVCYGDIGVKRFESPCRS